MTLWIAIALTALGCYLFKLLGLSAPPRLLNRPLVQRFALLAPVALLAALIAAQTFGDGRGLTLDARAVGLGAAGAAVALRAPFLVIVATAVAVTAAVRFAA